MNYVLFICSDGVATPHKAATMQSEVPGWVGEMDRCGVRRLGHALQDRSTSITVRVRDGETLLSDGPFVETKEFIGGFDLVDCASRQEAIELAAAHPLARHHMIEVRPLAQE